MTKQAILGTTEKTPRWMLVLLGFVALVVRLPGLERRGLWYDEAQSATFAALTPAELIRTVLSLDVHPPLYYLQLHFWMWPSSDDAWIRLNSVAWSLVGLAVLYGGVRRWADGRTAVLAGLVYALHPLSIHYGQEARMYTMLMCACACVWVGALGFARSPVLRRDRALFFGGISVAIYAHGMGMLVAVAGVAAVMRLASQRYGPRRGGLVRGGLTLLAIWMPWMIFVALYRSPAPAEGGLDWGHIVSVPAALLLGGGVDPSLAWHLILVLASAAGLAVAIRSRDDILATSAAGLLAAFLVSLLIAALTQNHVFLSMKVVGMLTPLVCVALARGTMVCVASRRARRVIGLVLLMVVSGVSIEQQRSRYGAWVTRDGAALVRAEARAGDVVRVSTQRMFWGWCWYFLGPGSVRPMATSYVEKDSAGVEIRLVSDPSTSTGTEWFVYRSIDPVPVAPGREAFRADYGDIYVVRVDPDGPGGVAPMSTP